MFSIYTTSFYGSSLWNIFTEPCEKLYTSWNISVRQAFDLPRNSHRYFIEEISETPHPQVLLAQRFVKFHETLQITQKYSVRFLSELASKNMATVYSQNLQNISLKCKGAQTSRDVKKMLKYAPVPEKDAWKVEVVKDLVEVKWNLSEIENIKINMDEINDILESICSS